jgi:hypothetical protein
LSFPRKRESGRVAKRGMPAFAGMTGDHASALNT